MKMTTNHQHHDHQRYLYRHRSRRFLGFDPTHTITTSLLLIMACWQSWLEYPVVVEVEAWGAQSRSIRLAASIKDQQRPQELGNELPIPITMCESAMFTPFPLRRPGVSSSTTNGLKKIPRISTLTTTKSTTAAATANNNLKGFILAMVVIVSNILIVPPSLCAGAYECPTSYSFPELGIQSVIGDNKIIPSASTIPINVKEKSTLSLSKEKKQTKRPISSEAQQKQCPVNRSENDVYKQEQQQLQQWQPRRRRSPFSVQAIVYAPSSMSSLLSKSSSSSSSSSLSSLKNQNAALDVIVKSSPSSSTLPSRSKTFAGATIPLSQIKSFPITISLGEQNLLLLDDTGSNNNNNSNRVGHNGDIMNTNLQPRDMNVPYSDDWTVVVTIRHSTGDDGTSDEILSDMVAVEDVFIQGSGTAKLLMLPMGGGEDDDQDEFLVPVRAAASIRLSASTIADRLTTW